MGRPKLVDDADLLAVAREVFAAQGFAASTREIARLAGVSEAVIYQRYATKTHLFLAAMVPPALDLDTLFNVRDVPHDVRADLEEVALALMQHFREFLPVFLPLVLHAGPELVDVVHSHRNSPFGGLHARMVEYLRSQQEEGKVAGHDQEAGAMTFFCALHSLAMLEHLGMHPTFDDDAVRRVVGALWTGLAP